MIRPYRDEDIEVVIEIWLAASRVAHPFLSDQFMTSAQEAIQDIYMPQADVWVWEEESVITGFITLLVIGGLFVSPHAHRGGIGTALIDSVRPLHDTLEVEVFKNNPIGRAFYEKYGFELMHEHFDDDAGQAVLRLSLS